MRNILLTLIASIYITVSFAQSPSWLWARGAGGNSWDYCYGTVTDNAGNIYITGGFSTAITFGSITLTNTGGPSTYDVYIAKYDPLGNVIWAVSAPGNGIAIVNSIDADSFGNIYITGYFDGDSLQFGSTTIYSAGGEDMFAAKLDSSGNAVWARSGGGIYNDRGASIHVGPAGEVYVAGHFASPSFVFANDTLTNYASMEDCFLSRLDAAGNLVWQLRQGGNLSDTFNSVTTDGLGNVIITGAYTSYGIAFGNIVLTNNSIVSNRTDMFIVKYDSSGAVLWAKNVGGNDSEFGQSIVTDVNDNIFITGKFYSHSISFDTISLGNNNGPYMSDFFIAKLDTAGNTLWALRAGGSSSDGGNSIVADAYGNSYVTGFSESSNISFGSIALTNSWGVFAVKFDPSGNAVWARAHNSLYGKGNGISLNQQAQAYVVGMFNGPTISFDNHTLTNNGSSSADIFIAKIDSLSSIITGISALPVSVHAEVFPNPAASASTISYSLNAPSHASITVYDCTGRSIAVLVAEQQAAGAYSYEFYPPSAGLYFIKIGIGDATVIKKLVCTR